MRRYSIEVNKGNGVRPAKPYRVWFPPSKNPGMTGKDLPDSVSFKTRDEADAYGAQCCLLLALDIARQALEYAVANGHTSQVYMSGGGKVNALSVIKKEIRWWWK